MKAKISFKKGLLHRDVIWSDLGCIFPDRRAWLRSTFHVTMVLECFSLSSGLQGSETIMCINFLFLVDTGMKIWPTFAPNSNASGTYNLYCYLAWNLKWFEEENYSCTWRLRNILVFSSSPNFNLWHKSFWFVHKKIRFFFQLKEHKSLYESYVPMKYKHYYKKMSKYALLFPTLFYLSLDGCKICCNAYLLVHGSISRLMQKWGMGRPPNSSSSSW